MLPLLKIIDFNDCSVNITDQLFTVLVDGKNFRMDISNRRQLLIGNDLEFQRLQVLQRFTVPCKGNAFGKLDIEDINVQAPPCRNFGV